MSSPLRWRAHEGFVQQILQRNVNVGMVEQNMTGVAVGLALCDKIVFIYSIANFRHGSKTPESSLQFRCANGGWFRQFTPVGR